jgi:hypothetical protein
MTFYSVYISSANLSGSATGMGKLIAGMSAFEDNLTDGHWKNAPYCSECKLTGKYEGGPNSLWHDFRIREDIALKIIKSVEFKWKTKRGLKKVAPEDFVAKLVEDKKETWFTVGFSEI